MEEPKALQRFQAFLLNQPNMLTYARYRYSAVAKNVLYAILDLLQKYQTREKVPNFDLFNNIEVTLNIGQVAKGTNYHEVWKAIRNELQARPIEYVTENKQTGEKKICSVVIIPYMQHVKGSTEISFKLMKESIEVLLHLGKGFTAYSKTVAIALPSMYSKRIYELCCRFRDTGYYVVTVDEFRVLMDCQKKFITFDNLRQRVIDKGVDDINNPAMKSDISVTYDLLTKKHDGRGRAKVDRIIFFIKDLKQEDGIKNNHYKVIYGLLTKAGYDAKVEIMDWLVNNGRAKIAGNVFADIYNEIKAGIVKEHGLHNYLLPILQNFGVPVDILPSPTEAKPKIAYKKRKE